MKRHGPTSILLSVKSQSVKGRQNNGDSKIISGCLGFGGGSGRAG